MDSKKGSENGRSSSKQTVCNGLKTASSSNLASQHSGALVRERTKVRASSAKYYDIASTILGGSTDVEELFLNSAKNGNCKRLEQLLQQTSEIGLNINCVDKRTGNTALIWASKRGHSKVVELLLRHGADATLCNHETQTALETAFLPAKTIILDWIDSQEVLNERLLLQAAWQGNLFVVRKVLQNKNNINVNCHNAEGLTPLILVCRDMQLFERLSSQLNRLYNPVQVAEELMKGKANIHVTDSNGRSCLHYASQSHAGCAEGLTVALVTGGLDIELCDKHLLTPLHVAAQSGSTASLVALVDRGSDVNAKGFAGLTPLHMTAFNDHHMTALTLLKYGADVTITDDHGLTPVDVAKTRKMKHTLKEAWMAAKKGSSPSTDDAVHLSSKSGIDENVLNTNLKGQIQPQNTKSKVLSNVDRCRQVERKILQEVEALKAPPLVLQRETTRMLGTTRTKILPQIGRSKSPEHSSKISQGDTDSRHSLSRQSDGLHKSSEDSRNKLNLQESSILDIGMDKRVIRSKPPELILSRDLPATHADVHEDANLRDKGSSHQREDMGSPSEIMRSHTMFKDEFILEESRPKEIFSSSDPASSISSGSLSSSSPRDLSFPQPSPTRSIRHDPILSTLQEQHISTHFLVSDSLANTDGKPLIMRPHKKLRRRSDNSLSSSLESDIDDLRTDKAITRSSSLKKSSDRPGRPIQEPCIVTSPLPVFKSQSLESISPKVQSETSFHRFASNTAVEKSHSDGNLDFVHNDHLQTITSDPCQSTSNKKQTQSGVLQNPARCVKSSKKLIIEPFIGKTRVLPKTKADSCKCLSKDASMKMNNCNDQSQEQKTQLKSIIRNVKDVSTAGSVKPQAIKSSQLCSSEAQNKMVVNLNGEQSVTKTSSVTNNVSIHSSPTTLNPRVSRPANLNTSAMAKEPATKQSCGIKHVTHAEEPKRVESVSKQKFTASILLKQLNITERDCLEKKAKQHPMTETVGEECKGKLDKCVQFKVQKNMQNEKNIACVSNGLSTNSCASSEPVALDGKSNIKSASSTMAKPSEQSAPSVFCKDTVSKTFSCAQEAKNEQVQVSNNQDSMLSQPVPKSGHINQEYTTFQSVPKCCHHSVSDKLSLNNLIYSCASKPNIHLKSASTDPLTTARFQGTTAKMNFIAAAKETNTVITTPVIVNPFEEFLQPHVFENSTEDVIVKVKKPGCSKISNKNIKKAVASSKKRQITTILRQSSAGKKQCARTKDLKTEKESRPKSGRKSGKGQRGKNIEKTIQNETRSDSAKPNTTSLTGIGWQLLTSRAGKSKIEVSIDLHLYSSDSDFSLDLDENENENSPRESDYIKEEMLNRQPFHAFIEQAMISSPTSVEVEHQPKLSLHIKSSGSKCDISQVEHNMTVEIHESFEQRDKTNEHNLTDNSKVGLSTDSPSQDTGVSNGIAEEVFSLLSPIPEISSLSKLTISVSDVETNCQEITSLSAATLQYTADNKKQISADASVTDNTSDEPLDSKNQHVSGMINENSEDKTNAKYEYTPSGKIARCQSLKECHITDRGRSEITFSEARSKKNSPEKNSDRNEDIDEIIEEILSSTTSSITSTMRNVKIHETVPHATLTHSLAESDKSLLLKMSQSVFASPFHATSSLSSKLYSVDTTDNLSDTMFSKLSSSDVEDSEQISTHNQSLTHRSSADRQQSHDYVATSFSNKPFPSVRSSLEEGTSRPAILGRSSSSREYRRHHRDSKNDARMTEEGAKQLVKILSNFKNMGLQANANCIERSGGSAKCLSRHFRNRPECNDHSSMSPSVAASASFRSKGRFQEIKDNAEIRISLQVKGGLDKQGQQSQDVYQASTVGSERSSVVDIKCDEGETIQWKKGNVLGRGAFGTVWLGLTSEGQLIAVKQIELTTMDKSKAEHEYENVQKEVELLKTLEHVNIVSYLGTSLEDNVVSIFMQFIPGGSIANILARFGALEESVFRHYTKQILEGVKYLHDNDVIHRDIKGANVMLMPNGVIKLIDFGCAKKLCINMSISQTELLKSMNGTPFWMAPEVVNESGHGKKSDIWSIGCTVFEMATRKPPWADMNPMAAIFAIGSSSRTVPTLGSRFSHDARDFVSQCMTRDQDARPGALELQEHPFITKQTSRKLSRSGD